MTPQSPSDKRTDGSSESTSHDTNKIKDEGDNVLDDQDNTAQAAWVEAQNSGQTVCMNPVTVFVNEYAALLLSSRPHLVYKGKDIPGPSGEGNDIPNTASEGKDIPGTSDKGEDKAG